MYWFASPLAESLQLALWKSTSENAVRAACRRLSKLRWNEGPLHRSVCTGLPGDNDSQLVQRQDISQAHELVVSP
jgi:hypothetical protein